MDNSDLGTTSNSKHAFSQFSPFRMKFPRNHMWIVVYELVIQSIQKFQYCFGWSTLSLFFGRIRKVCTQSSSKERSHLKARSQLTLNLGIFPHHTLYRINVCTRYAPRKRSLCQEILNNFCTCNNEKFGLTYSREKFHYENYSIIPSLPA